MLHKRMFQFLIIYFIGVGFLFIIKYFLNLSDYVIPGPREIQRTGRYVFISFFWDVMNTLSVAVIGHIISIFLAIFVGIIGRLTNWTGSFVKLAAYNIQAYPVVAVTPIIFILIGDGIASRLLISVMICYFPLLLSFIGILSESVTDIEHFYEITGRMNWKLQVKIRIFENIKKLTTVIAGSATLAMVGTIVSEFIAAGSGIGYSIRIALYQSDLSKILIALFLIGIFTSFYLSCLEAIGYFVQKHFSD